MMMTIRPLFFKFFCLIEEALMEDVKSPRWRLIWLNRDWYGFISLCTYLDMCKSNPEPTLTFRLVVV